MKLTHIDIFSTSISLSVLKKLIKVIHSLSVNSIVKKIGLFTTLLCIPLLLFKFPSVSGWVVIFVTLIYLSYKKPVYIFILLILTCELTPKINLGIISGNIISFKIEDILVISLFLATLWQYSFGRINFHVDSAQVPFLIFICIGAISLLRGIFIHTTDNPLISLFVMFRWIEYFILFWLAYLYLTDAKSIKLILLSFIITGIFVSLYGWWEYFNPKGTVFYTHYYRLYDRGIYMAQNNHMGGFFVLWLLLLFGLLISANKIRHKLLFGFTALLGVLPFFATYSRKSYLALLIGIICLVLFSGKKRYLVIFLTILLVIFCIPGMRIIERFGDIKDFLFVRDIFKSQRYYFIKNWLVSLQTIEDYPFLGAGFGSRHRLFYESQWAMIIAETGLLGFIFFIYVLLLIFKNSLITFRDIRDWLIKGYHLGYVAGFVGILVHSITCLSMVVSTIGIPFWIFAGVISGLSNREVKPNG